MSLLAEISSFLKINEEILREQIDKDCKRVKISRIPKRNGSGDRKIYVAPKSHRIVQYYLIYQYFSGVHQHNAATAYTKNVNILDNVQPHSNYRFFVKLDFSDFFYSIDFSDVVGKLSLVDGVGALFREYDDLELIRKTCFNDFNSLCIGYPVSSVLSNIVMRDIDADIEKRLVERYGSKGFSFTRYADDITIGVDVKGEGPSIVELVSNVLSDSDSPKLSINKDKTRFYSKDIGNGVITGLRICQDGRVKIPRKKRDHIRLLLSLYSKGRLDENEKSTLLGLINYARSVDPEFITKLHMKYNDSITTLKSE